MFVKSLINYAKINTVKIKPVFCTMDLFEYNNLNNINVKMTNLCKWLNTESDHGNLIRYLYKNSKANTFQECKNAIKFDGDFNSLVQSANHINAVHGKIWILNSDSLELNPIVKNFIKKIAQIKTASTDI